MTGKPELEISDSGTPWALLQAQFRADALVRLDDVAEVDVLIEFPIGESARESLECSRFVRLRKPRGGKVYALIR